MYKTTVRWYRKDDIKLMKGLKEEFSESSLSRTLLWCAREYYDQKAKLRKLRDATRKKYEIDSKTLEDIFY